MCEILIARLADIPEGKGIVVDVSERRLALFRHSGQIFALDETCPHRGGPLHEGTIENDVVLCPWHQWQFDLRTGVSPINPLSKVRTYAVRVDRGNVFVSLED